jgi:hypothetical protein
LALWVQAVRAQDAAVSDTAPTADISDSGIVAAAPTQEQADAAYAAARRSFMAVAAGKAPGTRPGDVVETVPTDSVPGKGTSRIPLEEVNLVLDVENVTLREVVTRIVGQAARYTGPWTVKWRLKPENMDLLDERVNLTVEAPFGEFCQLLAERVKNMSGTQLHVTAFKGAREILITDTYY